MSTIETKDGAKIFYKDWGPRNGQPIVFHHGWPLSGDDWDTQMLFFLKQGYRVIAHDRRGHGRSSQTADGHNMDTYAADVDALVTSLDLRDAIHVGHSTGGGEATRYVAYHGKKRTAKLVLIAAVPPGLIRSPANPDGMSMDVFDGLRAALAANPTPIIVPCHRVVAANGALTGFSAPGGLETKRRMLELEGAPGYGQQVLFG